MPDVTINAEAGLYVIPCGRGFSCLGFAVADRNRRAVLNFLGYSGVQAVPMGTVEGYNAYLAAMELGEAHFYRTGERCPADLIPELIGLEGRRVEVVDCHGKTRRFEVGKSTGWFPCHLEVARRNARDGVPVYGAPFRSVRVVR